MIGLSSYIRGRGCRSIHGKHQLTSGIDIGKIQIVAVDSPEIHPVLSVGKRDVESRSIGIPIDVVGI